MPALDHRITNRTLALISALLAGSAFVACTDQGPAPREEGAASARVAFAERGLAPPAALDRITNADAMASPQAADSARMLIRTGSVFIRVDSLEPAVEAVRAVATSLGGHVGDVSMMTGDNQVRSATLQLRIPAARFDEALTSVRPIGRVESSNVTAQDVGEEYVDVEARMRTSRRLEERLVTLLTTRTGRLEDLLAVERELARVRQEIEAFEARTRYLRANVSMSTIAVTVSERAPLAGNDPGRGIVAQAFIGAWRNFLRFVALLIESLGIVIPVVATVLLWRRVRRRRTVE